VRRWRVSTFSACKFISAHPALLRPPRPPSPDTHPELVLVYNTSSLHHHRFGWALCEQRQLVTSEISRAQTRREAAASAAEAASGTKHGKRRRKALATAEARCKVLQARLEIIHDLCMPETDRQSNASPFNLRIMRKSAKEAGGLVFLRNAAMPAALMYDKALSELLSPRTFNRHGDMLARIVRLSTITKSNKELQTEFCRVAALCCQLRRGPDATPPTVSEVTVAVDPILCKCTNVRIGWYCEETNTSPIRAGLSAADKKATHSDKLHFLVRGNASEIDLFVH